MAMPRRIRDLVGAVSALALLSLALFAFNENLRETLGQFSGNVGDVRTSAPVSALSVAVAHALGVLRNFGSDNALMSAFLVAAVVLVVLMLKV
jgi:hypothetical protein